MPAGAKEIAKKVAIATIASALVLSLTGCAAGNNAVTRNIKQVTDGSEAEINKDGNLIYLRNIHVAINSAGDASIIGTIINQKETEDALIAVAIGAKEIKIEPIPALLNQPITFGGPTSNASAVLPASDLVAGTHTTVSFFFGIGGAVTMDVLVVNA